MWGYRGSEFPEESAVRKVILPDPSTLIRYWLWGRVSMIWPVVFHRLLFVDWIDTICHFKSGRSVWAVRLYFSMSRALRWDRLFSRFRAAVIHSACGLYNVGWDGTKSRSRRWSNNWAGDKPMFWWAYFDIAERLWLPYRCPRTPGVQCFQLLFFWLFWQPVLPDHLTEGRQQTTVCALQPSPLGTVWTWKTWRVVTITA